jgi:hypothetical protein
VSYVKVPPLHASTLPLADIVDRWTSKPRKHATCGPLREEIRDGIELAWRDFRFAHPWSGQIVWFPVCLARRRGVQCLITFEFWGADRTRGEEIWQTLLETLTLA